METNTDETETKPLGRQLDLSWRVHFPNLLKEIVDCALPKNMGILQKPLQITQNLLSQVADRAAELNDPILNELMMRLTFYEEGDPGSKHYDQEKFQQVIASGEALRRELKQAEQLSPEKRRSVGLKEALHRVIRDHSNYLAIKVWDIDKSSHGDGTETWDFQIEVRRRERRKRKRK